MRIVLTILGLAGLGMASMRHNMSRADPTDITWAVYAVVGALCICTAVVLSAIKDRKPVKKPTDVG